MIFGIKTYQVCTLSMVVLLSGCNNIFAQKPSVNTTDGIIEYTKKYAEADVVAPITIMGILSKNYTEEEDHDQWRKDDCWHSDEETTIKNFALYCEAHNGNFIKVNPRRWVYSEKEYEGKGGWCRNSVQPYQPLFKISTITEVRRSRCGIHSNGLPMYSLVVYINKKLGKNTDQDWFNFAVENGFVSKY